MAYYLKIFLSALQTKDSLEFFIFHKLPEIIKEIKLYLSYSEQDAEVDTGYRNSEYVISAITVLQSLNQHALSQITGNPIKFFFIDLFNPIALVNTYASAL